MKHLKFVANLSVVGLDSNNLPQSATVVFLSDGSYTYNSLEVTISEEAIRDEINARVDSQTTRIRRKTEEIEVLKRDLTYWKGLLTKSVEEENREALERR